MSRDASPRLRARVMAQAKREVIAAIAASMHQEGITKTTLAKRMRTSRSLVNRMLDPKQETTVGTLAAAATVLGKHLHITVADVPLPARADDK